MKHRYEGLCEVRHKKLKAQVRKINCLYAGELFRGKFVVTYLIKNFFAEPRFSNFLSSGYKGLFPWGKGAGG